VTLRQVILVVLLIAAAFLGGAFVTGPGLQWAQARVLRSLGLSNGGEIDAVDLDSSMPAAESAELTKSQSTGSFDPIAPMPRVALELKPIKRDDFDRISPPEPTSAKPGRGTIPSRPPSLPSATPPESVTKSRSREKPHVDTKVSPAAGNFPLGRSHEPPSAKKPAPTRVVDAPSSLLPSPESKDTAQVQPPLRPLGANSVEAKNGEWALLVGKMQSLGVSSFTVEGEPGGHVVFACLIPLAGRQAVSQRFESSGDDVIQAARAALRRVVLWRATQPSHDNSPAPDEKSAP
jgi:hypothetical protein